ncbi:protein of unknown function [Candidatus Methylocalor cossyra]|uniref:Uncharacterized protein n=1 Tax=Candidatus Methylocalor cossyra TaxID=3108543 RepID=A0ABM9NJV9_9GAMM
MSIPKLGELLVTGNLHAEDFHCLDGRSRDIIRGLLLRVCLSAAPQTVPGSEAPWEEAPNRRVRSERSINLESSTENPSP